MTSAYFYYISKQLTLFQRITYIPRASDPDSARSHYGSFVCFVGLYAKTQQANLLLVSWLCEGNTFMLITSSVFTPAISLIENLCFSPFHTKIATSPSLTFNVNGGSLNKLKIKCDFAHEETYTPILMKHFFITNRPYRGVKTAPKVRGRKRIFLNILEIIRCRKKMKNNQDRHVLLSEF